MASQSIFRMFVIAGWCLTVSLCCQGQSGELERAWQLAAKGDRAGAINLLQNLVRREGSNADVRLLLGSLESEAGQRDLAIQQLTEATRLRPKSAEAWNALGEAYSHFDEFSEAEGAFERAVALQPQSGVMQANLGAALLHLGKNAAAAQHLDRAIALLGKTDEAADAHYLRGRICSADGQSMAALDHLQKAVAIRPDFAQAWSDLGLARKVTGDEPGALHALRRAVELDPQDAISQYRLGSEYLRSNELQAAVGPLEEAYRLNPQDQSTLNALQSTLRQLGRTEEAAAIKQKLAKVLDERDRKSQDAVKALRMNNEGVAFEKSGNLNEALLRYREAVSLNPEHAGLRTNYGILLLRMGQWTDGLTELHAALERDPKNAQLRTVFQDALAKAPPNLLPDWARSPSKE